MFDLLVGTSNLGLELDQRTIDEVRIERERHSFSGRSHCFAIEVYLLSRSGRQSWTLMVTKEYWWDGGHKHAIKTFRWSQPTHGSRRDILTWLRAQEITLQRQA